MAKGGVSQKNPPVIEKIGKPPLSGEARPPPIRRAKLGGKFLGFFTTLRGVYNFVGPPKIGPKIPENSLKTQNIYRRA